MVNRYFKCCEHVYKSVNDRAKNDATRAHIGCQECIHAGCTGCDGFMPTPVNATVPLVDNSEMVRNATVRERAGLGQWFSEGQKYDSQVMTECNHNKSLAPAPSYLPSGSTHASTVSGSQQIGSTSYGQGRALPGPVSYSAAVPARRILPSQGRREESEDEDEDDESRYQPVIPRQRKRRHE